MTEDNVESQSQEDTRDYSEKQPAQGLVSAGAGVGRALMDHRPPSVTEKLQNEKRELELRLRGIDEVLAQLEANPATREIIDSLAKLGHNY